MQAVFLNIYRIYGWLLWSVAVFAGVMTFAIMVVIDVNVVTRRVFNWPLPAGVEVTQSLLPAVIMLPFGYALLRRVHVNTVVFTSRLPLRAARGLHVFWMIVGAVLFAAVTYGTYNYAMRSFAMNEQVWGATIQFPMWPSKMVIAVGTALLSGQFLLEAVRTLILRDEDPREIPDEESPAQAAGRGDD